MLLAALLVAWLCEYMESPQPKTRQEENKKRLTRTVRLIIVPVLQCETLFIVAVSGAPI